MSWENTEKYKTFSVTIEKEVKILITMVMKVLSLYLAKWNLLIVQDIWTNLDIIKPCC